MGSPPMVQHVRMRPSNGSTNAFVFGRFGEMPLRVCRTHVAKYYGKYVVDLRVFDVEAYGRDLVMQEDVVELLYSVALP